MPAETETIWETSVSSEPESRVHLIQSVIEELDEKKFSVDMDKYELYLVLDEAISNALEHGNRWQKHKKVTVYVSKKDDKEVTVNIEDEGNGFDPSQVGTRDKLSLRGRGILIMKTFCTVNWNEKGNVIKLQLPLTQK